MLNLAIGGEQKLEVVTKAKPTDEQRRSLVFANKVCKHVKSNAIVYAKDGITAGIGAGQMNRRDSSRIAAMKAAEAAEKFGWAAPRTVGTAIFIAFILTMITSLIYGTHGEQDRVTAVIMAAGSLGGVYYGSKLSVKMPELFLRAIVLVLVLVG